MLHTNILSLDTSVTITENKNTEPITENEKVEAITENERAENYALERILADLKHLNITYPPDASHKGKEMKANYPIIHILREILRTTREVFAFVVWKVELVTQGDEVEDSLYCIICTNVYHHNMINDIIEGNSFVKTDYSKWKNARSNDKGFHQQKISKCQQQAI